MTREEQDIYDTYFELFSSPGWKQFLKDLEESRAEFDTVVSVKDAQELHQRQGQIRMIDTILGMPDMMEYAYNEAKEAESDA